MSDTERSQWYGPETATFGDRVAAAREVAGLKRSELAKRVGVKPKTLEAWEDDLSEPRANKLQMLAGLLNVSITWLLTGEGEHELTEKSSDQRRVDELLSKIATLSRRLDADKRNILASMLQETLDSESLNYDLNEVSAPKNFRVGLFLNLESKAELRRLEIAALRLAEYIGYSAETRKVDAELTDAR